VHCNSTCVFQEIALPPDADGINSPFRPSHAAASEPLSPPVRNYGLSKMRMKKINVSSGTYCCAPAHIE
jgi:hypothetical protein